MAKFPRYNPKARCPKCGYDSVNTKYVGPQLPLWYRMTIGHRAIRSIDKDGKVTYEKREVPEEEPAYLARTCVRCGYSWKEETVDVKEIDVRSEAE